MTTSPQADPPGDDLRSPDGVESSPRAPAGLRSAPMGAITVSDLSYAHPGGDLLFRGFSFCRCSCRGATRASSGPTASGRARSCGHRRRRAAATASKGRGGDPTGRTCSTWRRTSGPVRAASASCCSALAPARLAEAGRAVLTAERELAEGDESAGLRLGEAIGTWSRGSAAMSFEGAWDAVVPADRRDGGVERGRGTAGVDAVGRRAQADGARPAAHLGCRRAAARRARQLPRHPHPRVARGADQGRAGAPS